MAKNIGLDACDMAFLKSARNRTANKVERLAKRIEILTEEITATLIEDGTLHAEHPMFQSINKVRADIAAKTFVIGALARSYKK